MKSNAAALLFCVLTACASMAALPARAQNIVDVWSTVLLPPAPALKPVSVEPQITALLMLDFLNQNCGVRPRCVASIPAVKKLLAEARAKNMLVIHSLTPGRTAADVIKDLAPVAGEPTVTSGPDKFFRTDLEKMLADKGIRKVITVGTASNGAVLYTASGAAFRGLDVILPVDGLSSADATTDLMATATIATAPGVGARTTVTKIDLMKF